jgi:Arc/MetJ family transcription regulator
MATNLAIDDELIVAAKEMGHFKTKKETVTVALQEFIQRREMKKVVELFGLIDYDEEYDYKALRRVR